MPGFRTGDFCYPIPEIFTITAIGNQAAVNAIRHRIAEIESILEPQ